MKIMDKTIDITKRLVWEVSKEKIDNDDSLIKSQVYTVKVENQESRWRLRLVRKQIRRPNNVLICLALMRGNISMDVEIEEIGIESKSGYKPCEPLTEGGHSKIISKIQHFDGNSNISDRLCMADAGSIEDFLKLFLKDNKINVVVTLRFYVDRKAYINKNRRERNFLKNIRSISDLDSLTDFTVVCEGREFKCHRVILASMSTVFKTMVLNDQFVEKQKNTVTIEKASADIVEAMLEFMSKGVVPSDIEEKAIDLIDLADRYNLQDLIEICESSLVDNLTIENVVETFIAIDLHVPRSQQRQKLLDFIKAEAVQVVKTPHWRKFVVKYPDLVTEIFLSAVVPPVQPTDN